MWGEVELFRHRPLFTFIEERQQMAVLSRLLHLRMGLWMSNSTVNDGGWFMILQRRKQG